MTNFYKGNKLLNNGIVDNYIKGFYFDKDKGVKIPIQTGTNKYNAQFVSQLNELNIQFYALIRANNILLKLLKMHNKTENSDIGAIYGLMRAQSGTIKYNKILKNALKTYEIRQQKIYDEIKKELEVQQDRVVRNRSLISQNLSDFDLNCIKEFISTLDGETDSKYKNNNVYDIVDHILDYTDKYNKDIEYKPKLSDKTPEEYYEELDNSYIKYLLENAETSGVDLFNQISDSLQHHHEVKTQQAIKAKQEKEERKAAERRNKALNTIGNDNSKINADINNCVTSKISGRLSYDSAYNLRSIVDNFGGIVYYIAFCKTSLIKYLSKESKIGNIENITASNIVLSGITRTKWFGQHELDKVKTLVEKLQSQEEFSTATISIQKLCLVGKVAEVKRDKNSSNILTGSFEEAISKHIDENLQHYAVNNILLNTYFIDQLKYEVNIQREQLSWYNATPLMKLVTFYNIIEGVEKKVSNIRYFGFLSSKSTSKYHVKYKTCNGEIKHLGANIKLDMDAILAMSVLEDSTTDMLLEPMIDKQSMIDIAKNDDKLGSGLNSKWQHYVFNKRFDLSDHLLSTKAYVDIWFNQFIEELHIPIGIFTPKVKVDGTKVYKVGTFNSETSHRDVLNKLRKHRDNAGVKEVYIILACTGRGAKMHVIRDIKTSRRLDNGETVTIGDNPTLGVKLYNSYNEAILDIPKLIEQRNTIGYYVYKIDLTTL